MNRKSTRSSWLDRHNTGTKRHLTSPEISTPKFHYFLSRNLGRPPPEAGPRRRSTRPKERSQRLDPIASVHKRQPGWFQGASKQSGHHASVTTQQQQSYGSGNDDAMDVVGEDEKAAMGVEEVSGQVAGDVSGKVAEDVVEEVAEKVAEEVAEEVAETDPGINPDLQMNPQAKVDPKGKGKGKVVEDEAENFFSENEVEPEEEVQPEPKGKGKAKATRKARVSPGITHGFYSGISPTKKENAAGVKAAKRGDMAPKDDRNITLRVALMALVHLLLPVDPTKTRVCDNVNVFYDPAKFDDKVVNEAYSKLVAYDAAQYKLGVGTKVVVGNAVGKVKSTSYNTITIEVPGGGDVEKDVLYALKHAVKGQGVMTVEEDQRKFVLFLFQYTATILIHGANHVDEDTNRTRTDNLYIDVRERLSVLDTERSPVTGELTDVRKGRMEKLEQLLRWTTVNTLIWDVLLEVPAQDALRVVPDTFTPELKKFLKLRGSLAKKEPGSLLQMLGLKFAKFGRDVPNFGIFGKEKVFDMGKEGNAVGIVREISIGLQQAFRIGRFANLQSITFPLTPGKEFRSVCDNVKHGKDNLMKVLDKKVSEFGGDTSSNTWATQALLCLAHSSWIPGIPLPGIGPMTRPPVGNKLKASSEGASYSQMSCFKRALETSWNGDTTDKAVFAKVEKAFKPTTRAKRGAVSSQINNDGQVRDSRKVQQGRLLKDMKESQEYFKDIVSKLKANVTDPFMEKWLKEEVGLGRGILVGEGKDPGRRSNEKHLDTPAVREAAKRAIHSPLPGQEKVTCIEVSRYTMAMMLIDSVTSPPIRRQSRIKIRADHTFIRKGDGRVVDILSDRVKNGESLKKSEHGVVITSQKSRDFEDEYIVLVVMCRAVLREYGHDVLDNVVGPLDPGGHQITDGKRTNLFYEAGEYCLGIPRLGEHILRTFYCSMLARRARRDKINPEQCPQFRKDVAEIQGGMKAVLRFYVALGDEGYSANNNSVCGVDFGDVGDGAMESEGNKKSKLEEGSKPNVDALVAEKFSLAKEKALFEEQKALLEGQKALFEEKKAWVAEVSGGGVSGKGGLPHTVSFVFGLSGLKLFK